MWELCPLGQAEGIDSYPCCIKVPKEMTLKELGWNDDLEKAAAAFAGKGWVPARLIRETVINYGAFIKGGDEIDVILCGRVWHEAECDADQIGRAHV